MTDIGKTTTMFTHADAQAVKRRAREIWDENQANLPRFVRRAPDELDLATGAWARVASAWLKGRAGRELPTLQPRRNRRLGGAHLLARS